MRRAHRRFFGFLFFSLVALSGCGDDLFELPAGFGRFEGRLNDAGWIGYGYAVIQNDSLYLVGRRDVAPGGNDAEEIRVRMRFTGVGNFTLNAGNSEFAEIVSGFATAFPGTGQLQLATYDGSFLVGTVALTSQGPNGARRFESGTFDVPVFMSFGEVPPMPVD